VGVSAISRIYTNDGNGFLIEDGAVVLENVWEASAGFGDIDNDGDLDLILMGGNPAMSNVVSRIYKNDSSGGFMEVDPGSLDELFRGSTSLGDIDSDGDLDLILTGQGSGLSDWNARIYQNTEVTINMPPSAPTGPTAVDNGGFWRFTWNLPIEDNTPPGMIRYQIAIGTSSGNYDIISPVLSINAPGSRNTSANVGSVILTTNRYDSKIPTAQTVYWKVAAIDTSFKMSPFSLESTNGVIMTNTAPPEEDEDYDAPKITQNVITEDGAEVPVSVQPENGGRVSIKVYDIRGRLVRTIVDHEVGAGEKVDESWNLKNDAGSFVANGYYIMRIITPGIKKNMPIMVRR